MVTFVQINKAFRDIATAHKQINFYGIGDPWEFTSSGTVMYPIMWAKPENSRIEENVFVSTWKLIFADRVSDGEQNEIDVQSDMELVALDVVALLSNPDYSFDFKPFGQTLERFTEGFTDNDAGVIIDIEIRCPYTADRCAVPSSIITIDRSSGGGDDSGGGIGSGTVTSVGLTLPDTLFDSPVNGSPVTTAGTFLPTLKDQVVNTVFASPTLGTGKPTFRSLVSDDITSLVWSKITNTPTTLAGYGITDAGSGTVTSFSAGDLSPLFTTSVANATSTPALSFTLSNAGANTYFGNSSGSPGAPSYITAGALTKTDDTNVTLTLGGSHSTALLAATSLTLGWSGQLAVTRGGTGVNTFGGTNTLLYTTSANSLSSIATSNTSALVTSSTGVPSWASGSTANRVLRTDGTTVSFAQVNLSDDVTGVTRIVNGGTNSATPLSNNRVMVSLAGAIVENPVQPSTAIAYFDATLLPVGTTNMTYTAATNRIALSDGTAPVLLGAANPGLTLSGAGTRSRITVECSGTTGQSGIAIGQSTAKFSYFLRFGSATVGNWSGTSIALADSTFFQASLASVEGAGLFSINGTPIVGIVGNTTTNAGFRQDATGLRLDTIAAVHTSNSNMFTVNGKSYFGGNATSSAFVHIAAGVTGNAQIRLAAGVAPSSPNDGDIYYIDTNDRLMFYKNATASEILSASAVTTEAVASDTTLTITYNGTTYKLLARA